MVRLSVALHRCGDRTHTRAHTFSMSRSAVPDSTGGAVCERATSIAYSPAHTTGSMRASTKIHFGSVLEGGVRVHVGVSVGCAVCAVCAVSAVCAV